MSDLKNGGLLVVRIKRRRDEISQIPEKLCVLENESRSSNKLSSLSLSDGQKRSKISHKVVLKHISTINGSSESLLLDKSTLLAIKRSRDDSEENNQMLSSDTTSNCDTKKMIWTTLGKKTIKNFLDGESNEKDLLVVDMECHDLSIKKTNINHKKGVPIATPISRLSLEPAINIGKFAPYEFYFHYFNFSKLLVISIYLYIYIYIYIYICII